jgi:hypothetical protein
MAAKTKAKGATFEVFEMFTDRREFYWFVKDADGEIVDSWNRDLRYDDDKERMVGSRSFPTEDAARAFLAEAHPGAVDFHKTRDDLPSEVAVAKATAAALAVADGDPDAIDYVALEGIRRDHAKADEAAKAKRG